MEDWQKILSPYFSDVQDFGEYIGLKLHGTTTHPFNPPYAFADKLKEAGYLLKNWCGGMLLYPDGKYYLPIEFWKREFYERGQLFEQIRRNLSVFNRGFIRGLEDNDQAPTMSSEMASALLDLYNGELVALTHKISALKDRISNDFYPDVIQGASDRFWYGCKDRND